MYVIAYLPPLSPPSAANIVIINSLVKIHSCGVCLATALVNINAELGHHSYKSSTAPI